MAKHETEKKKGHESKAGRLRIMGGFKSDEHMKKGMEKKAERKKD